MKRQGQRTGGGATPERPAMSPPGFREKPAARMLFSDISKFMSKRVVLSVYGGEQVVGRVMGCDEVANCILETSQGRRILVLGKSVVAIAEAGTAAGEDRKRSPGMNPKAGML